MNFSKANVLAVESDRNNYVASYLAMNTVVLSDNKDFVNNI